jgi:2'-5' RNA ligase
MDSFSRTFDEAWQRFLSLESLRLVEETLESEWRRGRSEYLAFLVPIEDEATRRHIASTIERLVGIPGVQPYQESYWHVTVKGVGFRMDHATKPDEVTPTVATAISAEANLALAPAESFEARLGRVNALDGVVCFEVEAEGRIQALNRRLLSSAPEMPNTAVDEFFLPHVSIAHFTSDEGLAELKATLAKLRDESSGGPEFQISRVDLILARLSEAGPTFELVASYPLQSTPS